MAFNRIVDERFDDFWVRVGIVEKDMAVYGGIMNDAETKECERLAFVAGRDGASAALAFAQQGFRQYSAAIREADSGGNPYGAAYRDSLNASLVVYQSYIDKNEQAIKTETSE